jgi:hypothetical protein
MVGVDCETKLKRLIVSCDLHRKIILLFFLSSIVKQSSMYRQGIVKQSSIVKPEDPKATGVQENGQCPKKWTMSKKRSI